MKNSEFLTAVKEMRYMQKEFFKHRDRHLLEKAKEAERTVDKLIEENEHQVKDQLQGRLF